MYFGESSLALGTYLATIIIFILSLFKYNEMIEKAEINKHLIAILPVCIICAPLQFHISIMYRLTLYFIPIMVSLIPSLVSCYLKKKNSAIGVPICLVLYSYMLIRVYAFFSEEMVYIGPYFLM